MNNSFLILLGIAFFSGNLCSAETKTSSTATNAASVDEQTYHTAMALAIDHFDPTHQKSLQGDGAEHSFMLGALKAIHRNFPTFKDFGNFYRYSNGSVSAYYFNTLSSESAYLMDVETQHKIEQESSDNKASLLVQQKIRESLEGCASKHDERLEERNEIRFEIYNLKELAQSESCKKAAITELLALGLDNISFTKSRIVRGRFVEISESVYLRNNGPIRDMEAVLKKIKASPVLSPLFESLKIHDYLPIFNAEFIEIESATHSQEFSFKDPIRLKMTKRWGDCSAAGIYQCRYRHEWHLVVTPVENEFEAQIVSESGDPLQ